MKKSTDVSQELRIIARQIRTFRNLRGMTQEALAESADLSWNFIALLESGGRTPSLDTLVRLSAALGVKTSDLLADTADQGMIQYISSTIADLPEEDKQFILQELAVWADHMRECRKQGEK